MKSPLIKICICLSFICGQTNALGSSFFEPICKLKSANFSSVELSLPEDEKIQIEAREFFKALGERILGELKQNEKALLVMSECLKFNSSAAILENESFACEPSKIFFKNVFPTLVRLSRIELAMAYGPVPGTESTGLNVNLRSPVDYQFHDREILSSNELLTVNAIWTQELAKERKQVEFESSKIRESKIIADEQGFFRSNYYSKISALREIHHSNYRVYLQNFLLLSMMKSESPSTSEILDGIEELHKNNQLEQKKIADKIRWLQQSGLPVDSSALALVQYILPTSETLFANRSFCQIAMHAEKILENREKFESYAGLSLVAFSLLTPPAWAFGIGLATSGFWLGKSVQNYQRLQQSAFVGAYGADAILSLKELRSEQTDFNFQIVTLPLIFIGGSSLKYVARNVMTELFNFKSLILKTKT